MYIPQSIQSKPDYQKCINFHGHTCMGVTIGYLVAKLALELLTEIRSVDEELITIVETDACCCDAIQVLTGCTFGKGNFFYLDYGKMAFTFASRNSGKGVRLILKNEIFEVPRKEQELAQTISSPNCSPAEKKAYEGLYEQRGEELFAQGPAGFFTVQHLDNFTLPDRAPRAASKRCDICGEMVMETKLETAGDHRICRGCS
ncbi:MAG: formylmethanofuran dehydrogenase subunit E [Desulforhopalus sp.]|jgi:formylmethanofuran dehydrogenase subunit E